jgi:YD repeat-containing protein
VNGLVRSFADVDGDGLPDSVAFPSVERDNCTTVRDWKGVSAISRNVGGQFLPPVFERVPANDVTALVGPSVLADPQQGFVKLPNGDFQPIDWSTPFRNVDNGVRFADVNRDGRADLVLMGDYVPALLTSAPLLRPLPFVRFGTEQGTFAPAVPISTVSFETTGYFAYHDPQGSNNPFVAGRGPRDRRFGDFNGDGLLDIARLRSTPQGWLLGADVQASSPADAIASIRGAGAATAVVRTDFTYMFAGPASPVSLFDPGPANCTVGELSCRRKAGWVVREQKTESAAFDQPQPQFQSALHSYSVARADLSGRGGLGFERHFVVNPSLGTDRLRTTLWTKFSLGGSRYTYQTESTVSETAPVQAGQKERLSRSSHSLVTDTNCAFRVSSSQSSVEENEGGALVTRTLSDSTFDQFGNTLTTQETRTDGTRSETNRTNTIGANSADLTQWLINRYPTQQVSSEVDGRLLTRTIDVTYFPNRVEIDTATREKNGPLETGATSGVAVREEYGFDLQGNITGVTVRGDPRQSSVTYPVRSTTITMDARDAIYPVSSTNAEGHTVKRYFEAGSGVVVAVDDENDQRTQFYYDRFLRVVQAQLSSGEVAVVRHSATTGLPRLRTEIVESDVSGLGYVDRDPIGRVVRTGKPSYQLGTVRQDFTFDVNSRVIAASLPYQPGRTPSFVERDYDAVGRILSERRPGETLSSPKFERRWEYTARTTDAFSERNIRSRSEVDYAGREISNSTYIGGRAVTTRMTYGPFGTLRTISHPPLNVAMTPSAPSSLTTTMEYDNLGRAIELNDPDSGLERRLYTPFDEVKQVDDANGGATTKTYDRLGRPTLVTTAANAAYPSVPGGNTSHAQRSSFVWDPANGKGFLGSAVSVDGVTTAFTYDNRARLASETTTIAGEGSFVFGYVYNQRSQLERQTMPLEAPGALPVVFERTYSALNGGLESIADVTTPSASELLWSLVSRNAAG